MAANFNVHYVASLMNGETNSLSIARLPLHLPDTGGKRFRAAATAIC